MREREILDTLAVRLHSIARTLADCASELDAINLQTTNQPNLVALPIISECRLDSDYLRNILDTVEYELDKCAES